MKINKILLPVAAIATIFALATIPAIAGNHGEGKACPVTGGAKAGCDKGGSDCAKGSGSCNKSDCSKYGKGSCGKGKYGKGGCSSHASSACPISSKFCQKVCWIMEHKEELGLTDDQIAKIKALDLEVEKSSIRGMAEMKVFALELENRMSQDVIDVASIENMIDSSMASMALSAKATVKAYADLKSVATPEQKAKAKELKKAGHAGHHHHKA